MNLSNPKLLLHEEVLLLALRDEEGTFFTKMYQPAIGAALMAELLLARRTEVEEGKKKLIRLVDETPTGDPVLDEAIEKLHTAKRRASLKSWVLRFSNLPKLRHKVATGLCRKGVLREDEDQVLLFFRRRIYPQIDSRPERQMVDRLRRAIFSDNRDIEPRTAILLSLAKSADLLSIPFDKSDLKRRKERIKKIAEGELLGKAAKEVIEAAQAAILVTAILPAVAAASAAHGK